MEPRLKPSVQAGGSGLGLNDSVELSFSQTPTKGMQPLQETVSEIEMLTRAGKATNSTTLVITSSSSSSDSLHCLSSTSR